MQELNLKPHHKAVKDYYANLQKLDLFRETKEGSVSPAFGILLRKCAKQFDLTLVEQYRMKARNNSASIQVDGALLDEYKLPHGYWEAKDTRDDLEVEVQKKFKKGYPKDNIIFQSPDRIILYQHGQEVFDKDISETNQENLIAALKLFFAYEPPAYDQWERAVEEFKPLIPQLGEGLRDKIRDEYKQNPDFKKAFEDFFALCKQSLNPNLSKQAVGEMLIQHLMTERLFRTVFNNPDFVRHNIIAAEIEKVVDTLTSHYFSRKDFLAKLDRFYGAIETTAATIDDYSQKQSFLNTVYEQFFQGFSVKVADVLGIIYTPQPIVNFMVNSVEDILKKEFNSSLSSENVHILDPFVGTGSFIVRIMREMKKTALPHKYAHELHCNDIMLLPYYIASMNIEHAYYELTGRYEPFEGICFVDTFELAEEKQRPLFVKANTERVQRQKRAPIFVIIGNPPYNAGQVNENDNNKNRKYPVMDRRVSEKYGEASRATLIRRLNDPYVKAILWASERIGNEGIVALVTNNSFIDGVTFDGMRKSLAEDFTSLYILDLGGDVRKNPKISGTTHNVFGIQVGVSINLLVKSKSRTKKGEIYYARLDEYWRKEQKYEFLENKGHRNNIDWQKINPDKNYTWLTEGICDEFETFIPLCSKEAKQSKGTPCGTIFQVLAPGVVTARDPIVYDYDVEILANRIEAFCDNYNTEVHRYVSKGKPEDVDGFVDYEKVKWSAHLKDALRRGQEAKFNKSKIRKALYRPFKQILLYYDEILNDRPGLFRWFFLSEKEESVNRLICINGAGIKKPLHTIMTNHIPDFQLTSNGHCFPFYTYDEDGSNRRENITDWALQRFREHYGSPRPSGTPLKEGGQPEAVPLNKGEPKGDQITKWDIFHYVYGLLHHPGYREKYAANLKRELPRIPFAPDFWAFARAGKKFADLHVNYEDQPEYELEEIENPDVPLNLKVEKMKLSKDKTQLIYNDFLTLAGIPEEVYQYRLGNRSALEWIVDQYRVKTDKRSGIVSDPNRADDEQYIIRLIKKVITVSLETVKVVNQLKGLEISE
ncbi:DNA helicase [candidate division TA06 bacterium B3_TA06]|uniref:site-specific DNA-methyltransferase (adenine-specific) n=1 Tax=candidate division TA06 bacterium B3_TA06 TaxID=2012487 RepID=A0A532UU46_UNCT6|nr:MAG: DNA helicase [candidate division TA06 bacterium B3_TA06]